MFVEKNSKGDNLLYYVKQYFLVIELSHSSCTVICVWHLQAYPIYILVFHLRKWFINFKDQNLV